MSQENVEVVVKGVDALNRRDPDDFIACLHPDVVWEESGDVLPGLRGIYRGHSEARKWVAEAFLEVWESFHIEVQEITGASDGRVFLGTSLAARGATSGVEAELRAWQVFWFADRKIARRQVFFTRPEALEAAGLSESAMSQANVEITLQQIAAFNRQDVDAAVAFASPNVEWEDSMFWTEPSRTYRGRAELRDWMIRVLEPWESIHVRADETSQTSDGRVFARLWLTGRGTASGVETEQHTWTVLWFENGLITARRVFRDRAEALEAAGLSE